MNSTIRNVLVLAAVAIGGGGVAGAAMQQPQKAAPHGAPARAQNAESHRRGGSRLFAEYDLNHDGKITRDEFNKVVQQHFAQATGGGKAMTEQQFASYRTRSLQQHGDQMFKRADWNGDGKLSFDEYANPIRASFARADKQSLGFLPCHPRGQGNQPARGAEAGRHHGGARGAGAFCGRDDLNHDGKVTRAELDQALQQQFASAAKGGKFLNRDQFLVTLEDRAKLTSSRSFGRLDRAHSGTITFAEFAAPEQRTFARLDKNGDGVITRDEATSSRRTFGHTKSAAK
ncbi:MAG TPA: EF-hand domain-containing protein [Rhizomicrobium sp.]|jgi:Ca2+-binding EF-hand superfamily protein